MRIFLSFFFLCAYVSYAQHRPLTYGVDDLPQGLMQNPGAVINFEKHVGIPFLSGISIDAGANAITVFDIFKEGGSINNRIRDAVNRLSERDYFVLNQQLELLSYGWASKEKEGRYYSLGMYLETDVISYFPKDLARLAYNGNAGSINRSFDLGHAVARASVVNTYHFGIQQLVDRKWILGARAKLYSSIFNSTSIRNEGTFITRTTPDGPNFYSHDIIDADIKVYTSGVEGLDNENPAATVIGRGILSGNLGLGLDLGATYLMNEQWTLAASIQDIGFISHSKDLKTITAEGTYRLEGIEFVFPAVFDAFNTTPYWENLKDDIEEQLDYSDEARLAYVTLRPLKIHGSVNYGFGYGFLEDCDCTGDRRRFENNAGVYLYAIKRPLGIQGAATLYFDRRWNPAIRTKVTYTYDGYNWANIGGLISLNINKFNLYLATNNVLSYVNLAKANSASIQLGLQWIVPPK